MANYAPNPTFYVLMLDASGIQHYIFGSNQLKENIGASFIVSHLLYHKLLLGILERQFGDKVLTDWEAEGDLAMAKNQSLNCEVAFIGGGSAMLVFRRQADLQVCAREFSLSVLQHFPGIRMTIGTGKATADQFQGDMGTIRKELGESMEKSKQDHYVRTTLPKPGIVEDCPSTGYAAESKYEKEWVSQVSVTKKKAAPAANERLRQELLDYEEKEKKEDKASPDDFDFPLELDKMGQPEDKGYIAVIHLDGNGIGKRFKDCQSLAQLRKLSQIVRDTGNNALFELVLELKLRLMDDQGLGGTYHLKKNKEGEQYLPMRPLFVGGDDIVLISEGRIGMWVAERYIRIYCRRMNAALGINQTGPDRIVACAGVAIVKTKYPFFRAYHLGEELMRKAKTRSRTIHDSWIDFLVSSTGFNGDLDEVREDQYMLGESKLYHGPYQLNQEQAGIHRLKEGIRAFQNSKEWPRNKIMELRDTLMQDEAAIKFFQESLDFRGLELPVDNYPNRTLHLDMIELLEFYPKSLQQ